MFLYNDLERPDAFLDGGIMFNPIPPEGGGGGAFDARANFDCLAISDNLR